MMRIAAAHPDRAVREALRRVLQTKLRTELLWIAASESEIYQQIQRSPPDLLLLDVALSGPRAAVVKALVDAETCSVLMLADDPDKAVASVYEALGHGALAVAYPPNVTVDGEISGANQLFARIDRFSSLVRRHSSAQAMPVASPQGMFGRMELGKIVAIGASTGGPSALANVLADLPKPLQIPVLMVQHIEAEFIDGLAQWLGKQTGCDVVLAKRGDVPRAGKVYLADGNGHLVYLPSGQLTYLSGNSTDLHVPSVDMLFNSLAENAGVGAAALLTGMGADGASGLLKLRQRGWFTIAQDESSSAVFGMPRAAIQLGAASRIVSLSEIGSTLAQNLFRS